MLYLVTFFFASLVFGLQQHAIPLGQHTGIILDKCTTLHDKVHAYHGGMSGLRSIHTSFELSNAAIDLAEEVISSYDVLSEEQCAIVRNGTASIRDVGVDTMNECRVKLQTMKMPYIKNMFLNALVERQARNLAFFGMLREKCEDTYGAELGIISQHLNDGYDGVIRGLS